MKRKLNLFILENYATTIIAIILIVLKLLNLVNCSWFIVFLPVIVSQGAVLLLIIFVFLINIIKVIYDLIK